MKKIITSNLPLTEDSYSTSLSSSATSSGTTLTVYSISGVAINNILLIGEFGQEGSEIIKTHASTAPSGTTITLASALVKSHPKDTKVYVIPYDQVEFSYSSTATGTKNVLSTSDVDEESTTTKYEDTTYSSGYFFTRFVNSISSDYTDYSDPLPYAGFATNTVGHIMQSALNETNKDFSGTLTYDMLINEINACLRYVRGKLKTWSNCQEFNYILTQMNRGEYKFALPTTYYDKNSNRSMLQVRYGTDKNLTYKDKIEFDQEFEDVVVSQVATECTAGSTSLVLDSTDDFPSTGTFTAYVSNTAYSITVSANSKSTNTLTITALAVTLPVDTNVWYGESEGTPSRYSVWDGYLYVWPLCGSTNYGKNVTIDFYTDIVEVNSDSDEITLAKYDLVKHWLKWQIRNITERNSQPDMNDGDWILFNGILSDLVRRESSGQKRKMTPKINGITYRGEGRAINSEFDVV